jgi:hypothetical protein
MPKPLMKAKPSDPVSQKGRGDLKGTGYFKPLEAQIEVLMG